MVVGQVDYQFEWQRVRLHSELARRASDKIGPFVVILHPVDCEMRKERKKERKKEKVSEVQKTIIISARLLFPLSVLVTLHALIFWPIITDRLC